MGKIMDKINANELNLIKKRKVACMNEKASKVIKTLIKDFNQVIKACGNEQSSQVKMLMHNLENQISKEFVVKYYFNQQTERLGTYLCLDGEEECYGDKLFLSPKEACEAYKQKMLDFIEGANKKICEATNITNTVLKNAENDFGVKVEV